MRTTITLDSDVEALLNKFMHERGLSFKESVNGLLRASLLPEGPAPTIPSRPTISANRQFRWNVHFNWPATSKTRRSPGNSAWAARTAMKTSAPASPGFFSPVPCTE